MRLKRLRQTQFQRVTLETQQKGKQRERKKATAPWNVIVMVEVADGAERWLSVILCVEPESLLVETIKTSSISPFLIVSHLTHVLFPFPCLPPCCLFFLRCCCCLPTNRPVALCSTPSNRHRHNETDTNNTKHQPPPAETKEEETPK